MVCVCFFFVSYKWGTQAKKIRSDWINGWSGNTYLFLKTAGVYFR